MSLLSNPFRPAFPELADKYFYARIWLDCSRAEAITALGHPLILGRVVMNVKELQFICSCFCSILTLINPVLHLFSIPQISLPVLLISPLFV